MDPLLLQRLDQLSEGQVDLREGLTACRIEIAKLKVRSSLWGGLAGLGSAIGVVLWNFIF